MSPRYEGTSSDYMDLDIITFVMLSVKIRNFSSHYRYIESTKRNSDFFKTFDSSRATQEFNKFHADRVCVSQLLKGFNFVVCRARHMFLKVSQSYHVVVTLASLRSSQMEAKGVAVLQRGIGDGASEGSSSAEAGYRESTG
jgi:hypothetical protein